ncbi:MAG: Bax inhibitor-1/YccA family protein [Bacteroidia bacterium]
MNNDNFSYMNTQESESILVKTFLTRVFTWMGAALLISGLVAYLFGTDTELMAMLQVNTIHGPSLTTLGMIAAFAPLVFVLVMNFGLEKLSLPVLLLCFVLFSVSMGMSMSTLMLHYAKATIFKTLVICSGTFGLMAFLGATTKTDLSKMGTYLMMGLFGIIIASVINIFTHSSGMGFLIDIGGVVIFTGLASYQTQMLKTMAISMGGSGTVMAQKLALHGALSLYLTFLNLFTFLLALGGDRR